MVARSLYLKCVLFVGLQGGKDGQGFSPAYTLLCHVTDRKLDCLQAKNLWGVCVRKSLLHQEEFVSVCVDKQGLSLHLSFSIEREIMRRMGREKRK